MAATFNIIDYISGLTNFVFDKSVLNRVALDCGVSEITDYAGMTEELRDKCEIALLETIVYGPHSTANSTNKHGDWSLSIGSQTITAASLENIKARLRKLYSKYEMEEEIESLDDSYVQWINEDERDWLQF